MCIDAHRVVALRAALLVWAKRHNKLDDLSTQIVLGSFFETYRPAAFYWCVAVRALSRSAATLRFGCTLDDRS